MVSFSSAVAPRDDKNLLIGMHKGVRSIVSPIVTSSVSLYCLSQQASAPVLILLPSSAVPTKIAVENKELIRHNHGEDDQDHCWSYEKTAEEVPVN